MKINKYHNLNGKGQELYKVAKGLIPGGTQLFSKGPNFLLLKNGHLIFPEPKVHMFGILMIKNT